MNDLPFTSIQDNNMFDIIKTKYSSNHYTSYLGTNNDNLFNIDPDLNITYNFNKRRCQNLETTVDLNSKYGSENNIAFLHSNICSSEKKLKDLSYYLDSFDISFTFIGLCETWATKTNSDLLSMPGYNHEHCIRSNKKGGGVSIYILNTIQYKVRKNLALPKHLFESIFIEVDKSLFKTKHNVIIGEIYRSPSSQLKTFNIELEKLLIKIEKEKKYAFLMGDYNTNTLNEMNVSTPHIQHFSNILSSHYYHKLIDLPTRERIESSTLLDNIYTTIPDCYNTCNSGVIKFMTQSDHYPVFTIRNDNEPPKRKTHIMKRNHSYKNIASFKKCVNKINWNTFNSILSIQPAFTLFMNIIVDIFKECFPTESTKINYKNRNPWINESLKSEIQVRDKLFVQSKKHPTQENKNNYKRYKNMNLSKQRKAERDYYREQFNLHQTDLKKSWNIIKNIIGKEENRCSVKNIEFLINNQYTSDSKTIANAFNKYFINVGSTLANNMHSTTNPLLYVHSIDKCITIPEINANEVKTITLAIKNSASG